MTKNVFESFAKGKREEIFKGTNCVIYTRVSTKEQADNNMSLDTQRRSCEQYAQKQGYTIMGYFGGTYESAKTDERTEFNTMLSFVKKSREKISCIIVYSVDRFSRSGANAIYIKEQLRSQGVMVMSVTQHTDTSTPSGNLQQNIQFIFSEYDNQLRKEKCVSGTKEALLRGEWCGPLPIGYDSVKVNSKRQIIVNEKGKLLKKAFEWKAYENITNQEIQVRLEELGLKMDVKRISDTLRNPLYCGMIAHNFLEGEVVDGKHEKLISKELFLRVNELLNQNSHGYSIKEENDFIPLKRFLKCDECGDSMRGYLVKKKNLYYYKCNTAGCKNNRSANFLNNNFQQVLDLFTLDTNDEWRTVIKKQMERIYKDRASEFSGHQVLLQNQLLEVQKKIDRLEERYVEEDMSKDIFIKFGEKYQDEKKQVEVNLEKLTSEGSNLEKRINNTVANSIKLASVWASADYNKKQKLQYLIFPEGIHYNRKIDGCRTFSLDPMFAQIALLKQDFTNKKSGIPQLNMDYSALVPGAGVEPARFLASV